jgi:hypothetical protein
VVEGEGAEFKPQYPPPKNIILVSQVPVAHVYNPSYLGGWEGKDQFEASLANSSQHSISKITRAKWARGVAQAVEHLLY